MTSFVRELVGVLAKDRARYSHALRSDSRHDNGDPAWLRLCNRNERLVANSQGAGVSCDWTGSSRLHACGVIPSWGKRLCNIAFTQWPIEFAKTPVSTAGPKVSFIFAFRGGARLEHLNKVIESIFGQRDAQVSCVVVDLSANSNLDELPDQVQYHHVATGHLDEGWYKSWAYNLGANATEADTLVFHDGDICVPNRYAAEIATHLQENDFQTASIQRYLFYLNQSETKSIFQGSELADCTPEVVLQNWTGGTIAIRRDAFFQIGGFDEGFVDWGGEDGEFFDRCSSLRQTAFGYIPMVHLWHESQPGRRHVDNPNTKYVLPERLAIPAKERVRELCQRDWGQLSGPCPSVSYKSKFTEEAK